MDIVIILLWLAYVEGALFVFYNFLSGVMATMRTGTFSRGVVTAGLILSVIFGLLAAALWPITAPLMYVFGRGSS